MDTRGNSGTLPMSAYTFKPRNNINSFRKKTFTKSLGGPWPPWPPPGYATDVNLFSATGKQGQDEGNELTRDDFGNGYTFFGFDLTPDACDGGCFHLVQKGNLRIEIHFAAPLAQTVNVVVYGESEAVLEIDKGRNIIYDH